MSKRWDRIRLAVNAGYHARPEQQVGDVKVGKELTGRLGLAFRPGIDGLEAALTVSGARALREGAASGAEALAGVSYELFDGISAFAGGGAALAGRYTGTPSWRAMAGMRWTGDLSVEAELLAPPDMDGDGFADAVDKCPEDPEDPDGRFNDGCPDFDDDNDGVPDLADACPEKRGSPDNHGCPVRDGDGDGLADMEDNCPEEKGLFDGCKAPQLVRLKVDRIDLSRPLTFERGSAELTEDSAPLLDAVAAVINSHPGIHLLRVEGHTDNRGRRARNVELSQDRAKSVADALARRGLSPRRLSALGFGPARPIADNGTEEGRALNRRVEIIIAAATQPLPDGAVVPEQDDLGPLAEDEFSGRSRAKRVDDTDRDLDDVLGSVF
jgi:outer membrane protein OmpA-like peptidoglycan-associated protein